MSDYIHASERSLIVQEWSERLSTAEALMNRLDLELGRLIAMVDRAGDATGVSEQERKDIIHSAACTFASIRNGAALARRRIDKELV